MRLNYYTIFPLLTLLVDAQNSSTSEIIPLLTKGHLVPNILPTFNATVGPLVITYPNGIVNYGNNLSVSTVQYAPTVQFPAEADYADYKYVYAIIDPDAPSPSMPTSAQIRHYLVADVSPATVATNLSSGNVLSSYKSPAPPAGSAPHRYVSVLLRQLPNANVSLNNQSASTSGFNLALFAQQNSLTFVSANYFNSSQNTTSSSSAAAASGTKGSTAASGSTTVAASTANQLNPRVVGGAFVAVSLYTVLALIF